MAFDDAGSGRSLGSRANWGDRDSTSTPGVSWGYQLLFGLVTGETQHLAGSVFAALWDHQEPTNGLQVVLQHVGVLSAHTCAAAATDRKCDTVDPPGVAVQAIHDPSLQLRTYRRSAISDQRAIIDVERPGTFVTHSPTERRPGAGRALT